MTRNGVPSPADFRHCMEACEVASHVSRRFPTSHLKNGSCSFPVENLNRSQGTKRKRSKGAASSPIIVFKHISSTEIDQEPVLSRNVGIRRETEESTRKTPGETAPHLASFITMLEMVSIPTVCWRTSWSAAASTGEPLRR